MEAPATPRWRSGAIELFLLTPDRVQQPYVDWLNDLEVNRYLESRFARHTLDSTRAFVQDCLRADNSLMLGIRSLALDGRHVGNIKIGPIDRRHGLGEIGILIGDRACWGQGIGSSAITALCDIAQHELGLRKVTAGCYAGNLGSQKAFERAGFVVEGVRTRHFLIDGAETDLVLMARFL